MTMKRTTTTTSKEPAKARATISQRAAAPKPPRPLDLEESFPIIARFVREQGWIEIGDHEGEGWVVRALDYGGMIFESKNPKRLDEAMIALETGIAKWLKAQG